jgi:DNA-binding response OmpR family regulator
MQRPFNSSKGAQPEGESALARILVVDDESDMRRFCSEVLMAMDYKVDTANDGDEGWKVVQTGGYDLLITDLYMSGLSGSELVAKMRAVGINTPAILITGDIKVRDPEVSFDATLEKPFTPLNLMETVEQVLRGGRGAESHEEQ